mmetsp:Transcript_12133/g.18322  ORF Transcript_12133/g.18322 Transcript_12133/m.18322 type:complete len:225 (+) Transcript_12133:61-735(+)
MYSTSPDRHNTGGSSVRGSPEHRKFVEYESAMILSRNTMERDKLRAKYHEEQRKKEMKHNKVKEKRQEKWKKLTAKSPFAVDLVAEDERIQEENRIRVAEETARKQLAESRREKAKSEIILKALSEFSDLEALRQEKKAIMEEEQRLKALLALEKTKTHGKTDRLAAERAQRQRHAARGIHRRKEYKDSLDTVMKEEAVALRKKHALPIHGGRDPFTDTKIGSR